MTDKEFDDGLKTFLGDRYTDETQEQPTEKAVTAAKKPTAKPTQKKQGSTSKNTPKKEEPAEGPWKPEKPKPDFMDKLRQTAMDVCIYAVLSLILFWWKQTGKLDETTAWYALLVCVGMVFFSIGKNWKGWFE